MQCCISLTSLRGRVAGIMHVSPNLRRIGRLPPHMQFVESVTTHMPIGNIIEGLVNQV